ncbi:MAG: methyl-accepting chemotaxis protein [Treponema sp.]|nr:methyl-accepting chemotaxis protein [Treponema sp.]
MEKKSSILASYLLTFIPIAYIGVLYLSWIQVAYMHCSPETYLAGLKITLSVATVLVICVSIAAAYVVKPFNKIVQVLQKEKRKSTDEEKKIVISTYSKLNYITLIGCVLGFLVGNTVSTLIKIKSGSIPGEPVRIIFAVIHSISFGVMVCFYIMYITNENLKKYRKLLQIHVVEKVNKTTTIASSVYFVALASIIFVGFNMFLTPFGLVNDNAPEMMGDFLKNGILVMVVSIVMSLPLMGVLVAGIDSQIRGTQKTIDEIRDGSLESRIDITKIDDFALLTTSINRLIKKLGTMILDLRQESEVVISTASKLADVAETANTALVSMKESFARIEDEGARQNVEIESAGENVTGLTDSVRQVESHVLQETSAMSQSSASITEMTANIKSVADMTKKADDVSILLSETCAAGNKTLKNTSESIEAIYEAFKEVQAIVKAIQDIASQTNLLSMNASIEAAHAGEFGKGFSVVADEVRTLATSSSKSAKDIQELIGSMVDKINQTVSSIAETRTSFKKIQECSEENSNIVRTLSQAMDEQKVGAEENMRATESIVEDTKTIKDLVNSQNELTKNVEASMKTVMDSSAVMLDAIHESSESSLSVQEVITEINYMISKNKEAVARMTAVLNQFNV